MGIWENIIVVNREKNIKKQKTKQEKNCNNVCG